MDTGPHLSKIWDENLTATAGPLSSRAPDPVRKSDLSALLWTPTSADQSTESRILPSLPQFLEANRSVLPLASRRPHSAAELDDPRHLGTGFSFPVGPSPKRPRLSYDHDSGPEPESMNSVNKDEHGVERYQGLFLGQKSVESRPSANHHCLECAHIRPLVRKVLSGVHALESEANRASTALRHGHPARQANDNPTALANLEQSDLQRQLTWAATVVERCTAVVGDLANGRSQPVLSTVSASTSSLQPQPSSTIIDATFPEIPKKRVLNQELDKSDLHRRSSVPTHHDTRLNEQAFIMSRDGANTPFSDAYSQFAPQSPHGLLSSPGSLVRLQSPLQGSLSSRMLPSPSSLNLPPVTGQINQSTTSSSWNASAHSSHLQDLQHQISTKTLAIQTLQREHDNLLAAFSRQQTRCMTLDKKTKVSDNEIKTLAEEKMKLQNHVGTLEAQVEELMKTKEAAHQQSVASGAQYMQIMAMSSRLQSQSAADLRRFKTEKEEWETQKKGLLRRIEDLEIARHVNADPHRPMPEAAPRTETSEIYISMTTQSYDIDPGDILASTSLDVLRKEVLRLRKNSQDMQAELRELGNEAERLNGAMQQTMQVSDRIRSRAHAAFSLQQHPGASLAPDEKRELSTQESKPDVVYRE